MNPFRPTQHATPCSAIFLGFITKTRLCLSNSRPCPKRHTRRRWRMMAAAAARQLRPCLAAWRRRMLPVAASIIIKNKTPRARLHWTWVNMQEQQLPQRSRARAVAASVFVLLAVIALVGTAPQLQATALKFFKGSGFPDDIYMYASSLSPNIGFSGHAAPACFAHLTTACPCVAFRSPSPAQVHGLRSESLVHQLEPG